MQQWIRSPYIWLLITVLALRFDPFLLPVVWLAYLLIQDPA